MSRDLPTDGTRLVAGAEIDRMRLVATVAINGGGPDDVRIVTNERGTDFWVDDPRLPMLTHHTTIRKAFSHAVRGAGWG